MSPDAAVAELAGGRVYPRGGPTVFDASGRPTLGKVRYTHDAMIDQIIENPWVSQNELAAIFGYSPGWISTIIASDAFQEKLAARKDELVDPRIRATVEERFRGLVLRSMEVLQEKLSLPAHQIEAKVALATLETASRALGYGARDPRAAATVNAQIIVNVPPKAASGEEWAQRHAPEPRERDSIDGAAARDPLTLPQGA